VPLLMTVPGIAWVLGYAIAAEIGDIDRFASPTKLAGYTGLCPRVYRSGASDRRGPLRHASASPNPEANVACPTTPTGGHISPQRGDGGYRRAVEPSRTPLTGDCQRSREAKTPRWMHGRCWDTEIERSRALGRGDA